MPENNEHIPRSASSSGTNIALILLAGMMYQE
ncbi:predicted protein [Sclerotinia sclerotiorum 1980 UF-70]|uniref:Uncharacterized protein n=1 Tax=Sclerotinia sclerotiorum (strain ATCC 18683 / 1980 / Ss-1) TaxID=665079 RepID=A7EZT6_SCLS1|nr:predicted protein [Sclerotinia sclerotiorum 1980 UF-70]EDN94978.1 predicted protein [Sclerotinia sclerotiorum 1980 UF-70]